MLGFAWTAIFVTITCGIQSISVVTMTMKVLHNGCNMCAHDLSDMYARPQPSGIHIRYQANPSCPCYNYNSVRLDMVMIMMAILYCGSTITIEK